VLLSTDISTSPHKSSERLGAASGTQLVKELIAIDFPLLASVITA
jgi:hypothetical protein